jgi:hypothetical protein
MCQRAERDHVHCGTGRPNAISGGGSAVIRTSAASLPGRLHNATAFPPAIGQLFFRRLQLRSHHARHLDPQTASSASMNSSLM